MNDAEKELVAALRSGEYEQGQHLLRSNGYFCCLGVACDLYDPSLWTSSAGTLMKRYLGINNILPDVVKDHLGWGSNEGFLSIFDRDGLSLSLIYLNDNGFSFDQIADIISAGLVLHKGEKIELRRS